MFDNSSYENETLLIENFRKNPTEYIDKFEKYMLQILKEKCNLTDNATRFRLLMIIEIEYPKIRGACEILYEYFSGSSGLTLNEYAEFLIYAISKIKNAI